ncbi:2'-5' RNA ligase family protein [Rhodococcus sp. G-MC3]|uniref:2'-5' RNA ligase family protein n=1 Tax=Rhodococcus sp. G-MC3 TaxID=3046209 RepID=UPI0024BA86D2|nr:2'-5' RNA ligase family protein [Rhodococcus sp. G-MC3]MDJ0393177.1 2'-5' RNA ligase family protein [Rhodococcus sp. G-MC3]
MVQSLELILDDTLDAAVRREWQLLLDSDLPSQGRHTGVSNRPHITLSVADEMDEFDARIDDEYLRIGMPVRLGAFVVFRGKHATLARLVVPSRQLVDLHARAFELVGDADGSRSHTAPGKWTPHVTIARRMTRVELAEALLRLDSVQPDLVGTTSALRRWDGEGKREWIVRQNR